jgi:hypothetical protein
MSVATHLVQKVTPPYTLAPLFLCAEKDVPAADDSNRLGEGRLRKVRQKAMKPPGSFRNRSSFKML